MTRPEDQFYPDSMVIGGADGRSMANREDDTSAKQEQETSIQPEHDYHLGAFLMGQSPAEQILGLVQKEAVHPELQWDTSYDDQEMCDNCGEGVITEDESYVCSSCGHQGTVDTEDPFHDPDALDQGYPDMEGFASRKRLAVAPGEKYRGGSSGITITDVQDGVVSYQFDPVSEGDNAYTMSVDDFENMLSDAENPFKRAARTSDRDSSVDRLIPEDDEYMLDTNASRRSASVAMDKLERMKRGETVITNDAEMDEMSASGDEAAHTIRSLPNPNQIGTQDQYEAWIGEERGINASRRTADWLSERNNDPYGTPSSHEFWNSVDFEEIGPYRIFERDGKWYAHHKQQNRESGSYHESPGVRRGRPHDYWKAEEPYLLRS